MVKVTAIKESNDHFASEKHTGCVCVFAGATSGIGAATLERMASMLHEATIYVLGRSATRFASQRMKLESIYPGARLCSLKSKSRCWAKLMRLVSGS